MPTPTLTLIDGLPYAATHDGSGMRYTRRYHLSDLDLTTAHEDYERAYADGEADDFQKWLADHRLIDADDADRVQFCDWCTDPAITGDLTWTKNGDEAVCEGCRDANYSQCADCEEYVRDRDINTTGAADRLVCDWCFSEYYWCETCDERYHPDDSSEHDHRPLSCDCEAPHQSFKFGVGDTRIPNDETVTVALPSGVISDEGISEILRYVRPMQEVPSLGYAMRAVGPEWQTRDGNFTKRLSKHLYKNNGRYKFAPEILATIGNIARTHSKGADIDVAVTRDLNLDPEDFCNEDSCWWTDYAHSRCTFKTNGGIALRSFEKASGGDWSYVGGRVWILPLGENLHPVTDPDDAVGYFVFNGYGDLEGYTGPRTVAAMTGLSYRKISVHGNPQMYVNGDSGYIVSTEDVIARVRDAGGLHLSLNRH